MNPYFLFIYPFKHIDQGRWEVPQDDRISKGNTVVKRLVRCQTHGDEHLSLQKNIIFTYEIRKFTANIILENSHHEGKK